MKEVRVKQYRGCLRWWYRCKAALGTNLVNREWTWEEVGQIAPPTQSSSNGGCPQES